MHDDAAERLADPGQFRYCSAEELYSWLDPRPDWTVADLGSGPGLYTDTVADAVGRVLAIDRSPAMHAAHRARDPPATVHPVRADHGTLPVADGSLDAAVSLRTFHHGVREALPQIVAALRPGGRLVVLDWSASAPDFDAGPPVEERSDLAGIARAMIDAGCRIVRTEQRRETDLVIGERRV